MTAEEEIKYSLPRRRRRSSSRRHGSAALRLFFERMAFYGLLLVILLAAIPYGTVDPWVKSAVIFLLCLFASFRVFETVLAGSFSISDWRLLSPLVGILIFAVIQLVPHFNLINEITAPNQPGSTISYDPYETKIFILTFCALLLTGEVLLHYTDSRRRLLFLVYLVLTVGIGSALFGFAREVFLDKDSIILTAFRLKDQIGYAQFINQNHFVFLMEMTLGLLAGLYLKADLPQWFKPLFWITIGLVCFNIISANSRGGILSMIGLGLFVLLIHFFTRKRASRRSGSKRKSVSEEPPVNRLKTVSAAVAISILFVGIAIFAVAFVGGDPVVNRIESIEGEFGETDNRRMRRSDFWKSTLQIIEANPIAGTGFGAFAVSITPYDNFTGQQALEQAHNDYLETLAGGGVIAFLLMLAFLVILFKRVREQITTTTGFRQACCLGAAAGIFGVLLHSFVEFGLHTMINALIFTVLVVIIAARIPEEGEI